MWQEVRERERPHQLLSRLINTPVWLFWFARSLSLWNRLHCCFYYILQTPPLLAVVHLPGSGLCWLFICFELFSFESEWLIIAARVSVCLNGSFFYMPRIYVLRAARKASNCSSCLNHVQMNRILFLKLKGIRFTPLKEKKPQTFSFTQQLLFPCKIIWGSHRRFVALSVTVIRSSLTWISNFWKLVMLISKRAKLSH